jgi:hypothetical protein
MAKSSKSAKAAIRDAATAKGAALPILLMLCCWPLGCRSDAPPPAAPPAQLEPPAKLDEKTRRIPVELAVTSEDAELRDLVESEYRRALDRNSSVKWVHEGGAWRIVVHAVRGSPEDAVARDRMTMSMHLVEVPAGGHDLRDGTGQPTESIFGGTLTIAVAQLAATCANVVSDVAKIAAGLFEMDERAKAALRAGESDLVDDDFVRHGERR